MSHTVAELVPLLEQRITMLRAKQLEIPSGNTTEKVMQDLVATARIQEAEFIHDWLRMWETLGTMPTVLFTHGKQEP